MKRLQFRHNNTLWESRVDVLQYFNNIVDANRIDCIGESLFAEPLVARYLDEDGKQQVIFAIGVDSGLTPYHIIDSKAIVESIEAEVVRAMEAEAFLSGAVDTEREERIAADNYISGAVDTEIVRAMEAEAFLSGAVDTEREERIAADANLQTQITDNIAKIKSIEVSGANVLEEFGLYNAKNEKLGESIKIYKDSSLVGALIGFKGADRVTKNEDGTFTLGYSESERDESIEYLYLVYKDENGDLKLVGIDFENFLLEAEFGDGLKILDHVVSIKLVDGEKYLNVTSNGLQTVNIDEAIKDAVDEMADNLSKKIDEEIARSVAADEYISGLTAEFSAATVSEIARVDGDILFLSGAVDTEVVRAMEAEAFLSGAVDTEREERIAEDDAIKVEVTSNKVISKDIVVDKQITGTTLTIQTDEITITKYADAQAIYDSEVSILGSLLKIKQVETTDSAVKSRYELQGADGKMIGDPIILPVESALVDVKQGKEGDTIDPVTGNYITEGTGDTTMNFVYRLEDGSYELMQVVVSEYFTDSHFGRGLNNQDGIVSLLEGDGNEFLVIGEDTIAVVGVSTAIHNAFDSACTYAENVGVLTSSDSKDYTDTRIADVTSSIDSLTNTIDTAVQSMNDTLNSAVQNMNDTLNSAVLGMNETLNNSIEQVNSTLSTEISNREDADAEINRTINELNTTVSNLRDNINGNISALTETLNTVDHRIDDVASGLTVTINEVSHKIDDVASATTEHINTVDHRIDDVASGLTVTINEVSHKIDDVASAITAHINTVDHRIDDVASAITEHINTVDLRIDDVASGLTIEYKEADNVVLSSAKEYADNVASSAIDAILSGKVRDVKYLSGEQIIYLEFADGTRSNGFDASSFVVDGMLSAVTFDNNSNEIKFVWNTQSGIDEMIVPLNKFVDQYVVADDSVSFLKISSDNKISAIVDGGDGYSNTLASTDFVKGVQNTLTTNIENVLSETKSYVDDKINNSKIEIDTDLSEIEAELNLTKENLSERIDNVVSATNQTITALDTKLSERIDANASAANQAITALDTKLSERIDNVVSATNQTITTLDTKLSEKIDVNANAIAKLNGGKNVEGSVVNITETVLNNDIIYHGLPITDITIDDAKQCSLIRKINANGEVGYYASNEATDMVYVSRNGNINLNDYITNISDTIEEFSAATEENINRIDTTILEFSANTIEELERIDSDLADISGAVDTVSAITTENIQRIDADVVYVSGAVDTISAITTENIQRIDTDITFLSGTVDTVSAITIENIQRIDADVVYVSGAVDTISAITTENNTLLLNKVTELETTISGLTDTNTSLNEKIVELEKRIKVLEDKLANIGDDINGTVKDIIKEYLVGTASEIKVTELENNLQIGFDDDAIFGEI